MRLLILGTAAAEAVPGMFCPCRVCHHARRVGGREVRSRTAYMVGDAVRIDMSVDAQWQAVRFGLDHNRLQHLLVTHSHEDHFHPIELHYRRRGFCQTDPSSLLHVWGNLHVCEAARGMAYSREQLQLELHLIRPFEPFDLCDGISAVPVLANHASEEEEALNFIVRTPGRSVLIGNDTGYYAEDVWERLAEHRADIAIIDATYGPGDSRQHHLGLPWVVRVRDRLTELGVLPAGARTIANHFSHNGGMTHEELAELFGRESVEVAYDGMEIDLGP